MGKRFNTNLVHLRRAHLQGYAGAIMEGSSRSGKTWSCIDFIVMLCASQPPGQGVTINIIRETYNSFKTTLYDDFNRRFPAFGLPGPAVAVKDVATFWLFGSRINFLGADNPAKFEGASCDYAWFNEMLDIPAIIFDQQEQRCRRFWWGDYNPKASDHWVFNKVCSRSDVAFLHSTFSDNPFISEPERRKIMSYDPANPVNVEQGTADDYMWSVYGLGKRSAPQGLIFPLVTYIDTFPDNIERIGYGLDFGYTNDPTALVKVGISGRNIYLQKLLYYPFDNAGNLAPYIMQAIPPGAHFWADSADPAMIADLRRLGLNCAAVRKFPGSIVYGIDLLKRYKIHIVRDQDFQREQENYRWREVNGITVNDPIDKYNHLWDAVRYYAMSELRPEG